MAAYVSTLSGPVVTLLRVLVRLRVFATAQTLAHPAGSLVRSLGDDGKVAVLLSQEPRGVPALVALRMRTVCFRLAYRGT